MPKSEGEPNYGQRFDGSDYDPAVDDFRLNGQLGRVYECMKDHKWRTLVEICEITGIVLDASVAKQLRHLRYERFGAFQVNKRRVGDPERGLWEYQVGRKGSGTPKHKNCAQCAILESDLNESEFENRRLRRKVNRLIEMLNDK